MVAFIGFFFGIHYEDLHITEINFIMYPLQNVILIVAIYIYIYIYTHIYENFCVAKFIILFIYC